jgi:hypothetical protein
MAERMISDERKARLDRRISYDPACYNLAEHFFRDHPLGTDENVDRLAQHIQQAIEDEIAMIESDADK